MIRLFFLNGRRAEISSAENLCEELSELGIEANIPYISENNMEFAEFPETLGKRFHELTELYSCDAVILVLNAEKFLSIQEYDFVSEYVRYMGSERIILIINRLSSVNASDRQRVINFVKNRAASKIPGVSYIFTNVSYSGKPWVDYARSKILTAVNTDSPLPAAKMRKAIAQTLTNELKHIREEARKNNELAIKENEDAIIMNNSLTDFIKDRDIALQVLADSIRSAFEELEKSAFDELIIKGKNWYIHEFEDYAAENARKISERSVKEAEKRLSEDTLRLSISLPEDPVEPPEISNIDVWGDIAVIYGEKEWYRYRTLALYGLSACAVVISGIISHFNTLNGIITGLIVIGGGAAGDFIMKSRNKILTGDIQRSIKMTLENVSAKVAEAVCHEVKQAYLFTEAEFRRIADSLIGGSIFAPIDENSGTARRIRTLEELIEQLKDGE